MSLIITVETGNQVAGANSYISRDDATGFFLSRIDNAVWGAADDATRDITLATAAKILDQQFRWYGIRTQPQTQSMQWPRQSVSERDRLVPFDEIPQNLKDAQAIIAQALITNPSFLQSSLAAGGDGTVSGVKLGQGALEIAFKPSSEPDETEKTIVSKEVIEMLRIYGQFVYEKSAMRKVYRT